MTWFEVNKIADTIESSKLFNKDKNAIYIFHKDIGVSPNLNLKDLSSNLFGLCVLLNTVDYDTTFNNYIKINKKFNLKAQYSYFQAIDDFKIPSISKKLFNCGLFLDWR